MCATGRSEMMYCLYYQARVEEKDCWFLVAVMRSFEHLAFDRTYDRETSTFEFFVPQELESTFLKVLEFFIKEGVITELTHLPNRLLDPKALI